MSDKKKSNLLSAFAAWLNKFDAEVVALVLQDSNSTEIEFPDLEAGDTPKVGDKAMIDGSPIPDGSYIMPSLDNVTVTFKDGAVEEIVEAETEENPDDSVEAQASKKDKPKPKAEEINQISVWEMQVINTTFAEGDVVEYEYDGETYSVGAGEFQLKDGRHIVTDASGRIVTIKEATTADPAIETSEDEAAAEAKLNDLFEKMETKISAKYEKKTTKLEAELKALKKQIGSKEIEITPDRDWET